MKNIWYQKSRKTTNIKLVVSVFALIIVIVWALYGINLASVANKEQEIAELESSLNKATALCYAIEGMYPQNIEYLENNYGVMIDRENYIINYEIIASNIKPQITVLYVGD